MGILGILFFIGLILFYSYIFYDSFIKPTIFYFTKKIPFEHFVLFPLKLEPEQIKIIKEHSNFYKKLKPKYQISYQHRVAKFLKNYPFIGRENLEITDEIKIAIATTAVKLTFGLEDFYFSSFNKILVYPSYYFSRINNENHVGEFNPQLKLVIFSWEHFQESLFDKRDNLNLGIHEFSHALVYEILNINNGNNNVTDNLFREKYAEIKSLFHYGKYMDSLKEMNYLRDYAYENILEFIAVCLEHYYETPEEFKQKLPNLYSKIEGMINTNERFFAS